MANGSSPSVCNSNWAEKTSRNWGKWTCTVLHLGLRPLMRNSRINNGSFCVNRSKKSRRVLGFWLMWDWIISHSTGRRAPYPEVKPNGSVWPLKSEVGSPKCCTFWMSRVSGFINATTKGSSTASKRCAMPEIQWLSSNMTKR